ncbi:MAG: hypothetical protein QXJ97_05560 [Desulfurococcaceae archaeon]
MELEKVRDLVIKAEITKLVELKPIDERYPYIFAMVASRKGIDKECMGIVESMLAKGEITQNDYKRYKRELLDQCMTSLERERVKEIISAIETYLLKIKPSS